MFIAVAQTVFQNGLVDGIARNAPELDPTIFINAGASQVREILASMHMEQYTEAVLGAYLQGLRNSYYISVACAAAAFFSALGLSWINIKKVRAQGQGQGQEKGDGDDAERDAGAVHAPAL